MNTPLKNRFSQRDQIVLWLAFVGILCALGSTVVSLAQGGPVVTPLEVSCKKRKATQHGLEKPRANGNAWVFRVIAVDGATIRPGTLKWTIHLAGGRITMPPGVNEHWGSFAEGDENGTPTMTWDGVISESENCNFTVTATGKLDCGGGGGEGPGEDVEFEATWDGRVAAELTVKHCDGSITGPTSCTACGCPNPISQEICHRTKPYYLPTAFGLPVWFSQVFNSLTNTWSDNYHKTAKTNSDGSTTVTSPGGREDKFGADGKGEAGDERTALKKPDGSLEITNPDGSKEIYHSDGQGGLILAGQQDALGNAVTLTRDASGNLTKVTAADGQELNVTHNGAGQVSGVSSTAGGDHSFTYDANGRLSSETDALGLTTDYQYDSQGRITQITTPLGTTKYTYEGGDGNGETGYSAPGAPMGYAKRTTIEHPDGSKEEWFWDGYGTSWHVAPADYVAYTTADNNASDDVPKTISTVKTIAGEDRITQETDPLGNVTSYEYDPTSGRLLKVTAADGTHTSTTYNSKGNPLVVTTADGKTTTFEYAANGEDVTTIKDSAGSTVATFTYDANHNVLTATDRDGHTTTDTYTDWGAVESVTDESGKTTTNHYDATTKLLTSVSVEGSTLVSYAYDSKQRVHTTTDATGTTLTYDYDDADRLIKTTYPDGTHEDISHASCCGVDQPKPTLITDRSGRTTEFTYDAMGRTTKVIDPLGSDVEYSYDANGQLKQLKDTKNNATTYDYDANGQVTKKTYADGTYETSTYNNVGQLIGARDAKNNVAAYEYDAAGRMTKIDYPHDTDVTMSYDALGRLSTKTDGLGTTEYSYDNLNRPTSEDGPWDNDTISYSYDALGRRTAFSINGSAQANYSYDDFDRLTSVSKGTSTFNYTYNGASDQLTQLTLPGGAKTEYSYDAMQHLTQVQSLKSDGTTTLAQFDYSYNTRDVRTSVEKQIGAGSTQTVNYTYDGIDQLTKELSTEQTPALNKEYSYDAMGNRISSSVSGISTSYAANNLNQITQLSVGGNNTAIVYDANGNTIQQGNKTFGYNDADQLTSVVVPNDKKSEFVYDSDGRKRISKDYSWNAANQTWTQTDETRFVYDGMDLVQERAADGSVNASYVRDGNIGGVLSMTNADGTFTYHYDGSGNVVALTDANQNIVAQYSYDAFGNTLSASGAQADKNPFRFSSKYYDGETGLYDYGLRHYDSSLGQWINRDPIGEDGGLNLYGMVGNNPTNSIDEYGLQQSSPTSRQGIQTQMELAK